MKNKRIATKSHSGPKTPDASELGQSRAFRWLLCITVFWSGACLMIIELAANRVLAPWFGNS